MAPPDKEVMGARFHVDTDPPAKGTERKPSPLPAPSQRPEQAIVAAQARDLERIRAERDKARADAAEAAAARDEARAAAAAAVPHDARATMSDETIGRFVREVTNAVAKRLGLPAFFITCLGGGSYLLHAANEKPVPPPLTAGQLDERLAKFESKVVGRLDTLTVTANGLNDVMRCVRKKTNQVGGSLLPAPDRVGSALKISAYEDDCPDSPKRLPDPPIR